MSDWTGELAAWGWDTGWARALAHEGEPARVVAIDRGRLTLRHATGVVRGVWRPRGGHGEAPAVGDWCVVSPGTRGDQGPVPVRSWLPRRTALTRRAAGRATRAQVLAANIDTVALVCGLDSGAGIRALERLVTLVLDGGALPLVVLNKADLCPDVEGALAEARRAAPGVEALAVSAANGEGLDTLGRRLAPGTTAALLGPSGVGKSSLTNALAGDALEATGAVRDSDHRGRHTTVRRTLHRLPTGLLLIDTPGLRELGVWLEGDGLRSAFDEVEALATRCRFRDCTHDDEPGCAVRQALSDGRLEPRRLERYLELRDEALALERRRDDRSRKANSKARSKDISPRIRRFKRQRP
jgi:ribosome biogenesis GTPase / thiamine phosphate phosphatase